MLRTSPLILAAICCAAIMVAGPGCSDDGDADPTATVGASSSPAISPTTIPLVNASTICASGAAPTSSEVGSPDLLEASGLAVSRTQEGVIWAHNDSGDVARVFAMNDQGETLASYEVRGVTPIDWEDMAVGPGAEDGTRYLYLGDIGDNAAQRDAVQVYRVPEPTIDPASSLLAIDEAERLVLLYPDGAHDAETLLVDPITGDLFIVTKELATGLSGVYRASARELVDGQNVTMERVAEIDFYGLRTQKEIPPGSPPLANVTHVPTGGDIAPDGSVVVLRTYATVWVWDRFPSAPLAEAFAEAPCEGPSEIEPQGEAIAFGAAGTSYYTVSEGEHPPLYRFGFD
jgi:hypothetical protein